MKKERNIAFDLAKAILIYLVVLGHCLQYMGGADMTHNWLMSYIYAFHMPCFFLVSGFFFRTSLSLDWLTFIKKKAINLLLPCVVWLIVRSLLNIAPPIFACFCCRHSLSPDIAVLVFKRNI